MLVPEGTGPVKRGVRAPRLSRRPSNAAFGPAIGPIVIPIRPIVIPIRPIVSTSRPIVKPTRRLAITIGRIVFTIGRIALAIRRLGMTIGRMGMTIRRLGFTIRRLGMTIGRISSRSRRIVVAIGRIVSTNGRIVKPIRRLGLTIGRIGSRRGELGLNEQQNRTRRRTLLVRGPPMAASPYTLVARVELRSHAGAGAALVDDDARARLVLGRHHGVPALGELRSVHPKMVFASHGARFTQPWLFTWPNSPCQKAPCSA